MTTKKKTTTPKSGEKAKKATAPKTTAAKTLLEPAATATRATMKADKADKADVKAVEAKVEAKVEARVEANAVAPRVETKAAPQAVAPAPIEVTVSTEKPVLTIGMFQKRLHERGYYQGWWDGQYGPLTKHAVARFQADHGLHADGEPTQATLAKLGF